MKIKANKALGQHFLFSREICDSIVSSAPRIQGAVVIEIGPGHGSLTSAILQQQPKHLFMIEKDKLLAVKLKAMYQDRDDVSVICADALKINIAQLSSQKVIIISNLPYNIGTELLCDWLCHASDRISHMTLMLQKELVERVCALKTSPNYGRLSVLCQLLAKCSKSFDVDAKLFTPPPKVTSSILQIEPLDLHLDQELFKLFQQILRIAFSARRKMLRKALGDFFNEDDFYSLNIPATLRPQDLSSADFWRIAAFYKAKVAALKVDERF